MGEGAGGGKGGKSGAGERRREVKSRQEEGGNNKEKERGRMEMERWGMRGQGERRDGLRITAAREERGGRDGRDSGWRKERTNEMKSVVQVY